MNLKSFGFRAFTILSVFIVLVFAFRSLATHPYTRLPDWNDYPFYVWTIYQNIGHFKSHTIHGFFDTNIYYPYKDSLLFSDLLLPQSLIALPFALIFSTPVFVFNILFFLTLLLDVIAVLFFWEQVTQEKASLYFAVFATCVSGLLFQNSVHFQFLGFWPFFFGLGYLVRPRKRVKDVVLLGAWAGIQFLAGVYLAVFLLCATGVWYGLEVIRDWKNKKNWIRILRESVVILCAFLLICGPFAYKYIQVKKAYNITREYWEYIYYSAHLSDYVFSTNYGSLLSKFWIVAKWNSYNHAGSLFPGFVLSALALVGLFFYKKTKNLYSLSLQIEEKGSFLLSTSRRWFFCITRNPSIH